MWLHGDSPEMVWDKRSGAAGSRLTAGLPDFYNNRHTKLARNYFLRESSMRRLLAVFAALSLLVGVGLAQAADKEKTDVPAVLSYKMKNLEGKETDLSQYQ